MAENGLVESVRTWIERLESGDAYCGTLRKYHSHAPGAVRPDTNITVWHLGEPRTEALEARSVLSGFGISWTNFVTGAETGHRNRESRNLSILSSVRSTADVHELELARKTADADWPDLLLIGIALDRLMVGAADSFRDLLIRFYHMLEPGGMIVMPLSWQPDIVAQVALQLAEGNEFDQSRCCGDCLVFNKETSIYTATTIKVANRSSIFDPGSCELSVTAAFRDLNLPAGSRVLDVGVGDGRFSQHFLRETVRRGGEYFGIEMTSKPEIRPKYPEVAARTRFDTNFFCLDEAAQYDLVILFFVFHSVKHWPLFFYQARNILKPGGLVMFANRDDRIIRWTHGRFFNTEMLEASAVREETVRYWDLRQKCGVRTFDQTTTIIDRERCTQAANEMGFINDRVVVVDFLRQYCLDRRQLSPGEDDPAMWNIGRVGLTRSDRRSLSGAFSKDVVEEALVENVFVSMMRKSERT
jgi:SAM-dependent methyltransferase